MVVIHPQELLWLYNYLLYASPPHLLLLLYPPTFPSTNIHSPERVKFMFYGASCCFNAPSTWLKHSDGALPVPPSKRLQLARLYCLRNVFLVLKCVRAASRRTKDPRMYELAEMWFAPAHSVMKCFVHRTVGLREFMIPVVVAAAGLVWMEMGREGRSE